MSTRYNFFGGLVTDGLILNLDAAKLQSYSGSSDNWYDISGNNRNGKLLNGPTFSGFEKQASIFFDGTDDVLSFTATSINNDSFFNSLYPNGLSITTWFKLPSNFNVPNTDGRSILYRGNDGAEGNWWHYSLNQPVNNPSNGVRQRFWIGAGTSYSPWIHYGEYRLQSGSTYFGTMTWNPINSNQATVRLYLNGSLEYEKITTKSSGISLRSANILGNFPGSGWSPYFNQHTLSVYNKAISPFDVFQNYNAIKGRFGFPDIVTSGLTLNLDAGNPYSYSPDNTSTNVFVDVSYTTTGGTLSNGAYYSGGTIVFDGTDDNVNCGRAIDLTTYTSFTVELWFNADVTTSAKPIFSIADNPGGTEWQFWMGIFNGKFYLEQRDGTDKTITSTSNVLTNTWYQFVGTWNGTTTMMYVNTVLNGSVIVSKPINPSKTLYLGIFPSYAVFDGKITSCKIYNRALSQAEITQNFNATRGRYGI